MDTSHAAQARALVHGARTATLSTLALDPPGFPFGSLVSVADDGQGRPLLLLSALAEHTRNLEVRPEASLLLLGEAPTPDPLSAPRLSLLGPCALVPETEIDAARACFLAAHPEAQGYASFRDFAFYRIEPQAARFVGGFGRMSWLDVAQYLQVQGAAQL